MSLTKLVIVLGGPGSGKSTVSSIVNGNVHGSVPVKCGQLVRKQLIKDNTLADDKESVIHAMHQGELVKDDIVCKLLNDEIETLSKTGRNVVVLDGFPRTRNQLELFLKNSNVEISIVFCLEAPHQILENRCKLRNLKTDRVDDRKAPVEARITDYNRHIPDIKNELNKRKITVAKINTVNSFPEMTKEIVDNLKIKKLC